MTYTTIRLIREILVAKIERASSGQSKAWERLEKAARDLGISLDEAVEHPKASAWYDIYCNRRDNLRNLEAALEDFLSHDWH